MQFDDIVVGGGTAGAVISARLSEERERRVLLLEAGPDYPDTVPRELLDASFAVLRGHNWDMQATVSEGNHAAGSQGARINRVFEMASTLVTGEVGQSTTFAYPLGKVTGGGSAVNGGLALHARPEDYARWSAAGCEGWSWAKVRPYADRIATADCNKPALVIETTPREDLTRCQRAFLLSCEALGMPPVDLCQGITAGVGPIPKNVRQGRRVSTSTLYLAAARSRTNLTIRSNCLVEKLCFGSRNGSLMATGVEALVDGKRCGFSAGHITLSAGAINSPAILLRSGIGPAAEITRNHFRPVVDLPGVGKNLQDHPSVCIWATPRKGSCVAGEPVHQIMAQRKSKASEVLCDVQLYMLSAVPTQDLPALRLIAGSETALGISALLATPRSRGCVSVFDADATRHPRVYLNCLQESSDLRSMMEAVRSAWCILCQGPLAVHFDRILLWTQNILDRDVLLEKSIRAMVRGTWHPVGTLRMGREGDRMAVVDQRGRLYGCQNVTVADASIMPIIPSVPPNLTCMLIGERIAADLRCRAM